MLSTMIPLVWVEGCKRIFSLGNPSSMRATSATCPTVPGTSSILAACSITRLCAFVSRHPRTLPITVTKSFYRYDRQIEANRHDHAVP